MSRCLPQRLVHDLGSVDFTIAGVILPFTHVSNQVLEKRPASRMPEHGTRRFLLKVEEVHDSAETTMVALFRLLEHAQILAQLLVIGPGCPVNALQHLVVGVAPPIRAGHPRQFEGIAEFAGRWQMRAATEVDEFALPIQGQCLGCRYAFDNLGFVMLTDTAKVCGGLVTIPDFANNRFVTFDDRVHFCLDRFEITLGKRFSPRKIVIETVFDGRADRYLRFGPDFFHCLGQDVRRIVS